MILWFKLFLHNVKVVLVNNCEGNCLQRNVQTMSWETGNCRLFTPDSWGTLANCCLLLLTRVISDSVSQWWINWFIGWWRLQATGFRYFSKNVWVERWDGIGARVAAYLRSLLSLVRLQDTPASARLWLVDI